ncbi:D-alanyl-D-alanine endopeptidase [Cupriavidus sp. SK-4]|uniref:LysR family transcriptional regulator n=1 Tax=Cupriavidus sp. SK-4 TaxID=574750 RepID=UPI00044508B0|nr:LysR substrate-binding domain-containing protein [Cupriavidus sp. SK-4]EYS92668.1 D-alanyl-D-alanine endopeptidase [Cupriavidus sp. SK-4]
MSSKSLRTELRHLRCFLAVAEELHFTRAAERLHMEQSPLSRAIRELEEDLGVLLFARTTRSTRLTRAGEVLLENLPAIFAAVGRARDCVQAVANGFHDQLRIVLSDCSARSRLPALLALWREDEPAVEVRLFEVPLSKQIEGLNDGLYDVGFSLTNDVGDGIIAHPLWREPLVVALPLRHPLLAYPQIPLEELLRYPLVLCDPQACEGHARLVDRLLRCVDQEPLVVDRVSSFELMMTLVSAGLALGLTGASHALANRGAGVVARPLAGQVPLVTTYLLRRDTEPSVTLTRFIERASAVESRACSETCHDSQHNVEEDVAP